MSISQIVVEKFTQYFNASPELTVFAPGRVNLIGEHTDYNDGFVLPTAINFGTYISVTKRNDRTVNIIACDIDNETETFDLDDIEFNHEKMWVNYVRGTLKILLANHPDISGADLAVKGNVPQGTGLSSSASFENAILKAFASINNINLDGVDAALMAQKAENTFVGCNCGIMDQLISALGKQGNAMLLDCRSLTYEYASIPDGMSLVIVNSNVKRTLVGSEYNTRREQCEAAAKHFNKPALRDVTIEELESERNNLPQLIYQRAKHVITENDRTIQSLKALNQNDMASMSTLMAASHVSMKDDFEITTPELDTLVDIIANVLGDKGGARMTGGGFGGCAIALTPNHLVAQVEKAIADQYPQKTGLVADVYVCVATDGAFVN